MGSDKQLIKERFEASFGRYNRLALVQQRICRQLANYLMERRGNGVVRALEVGAGTGFLTDRLTVFYPEARWFVNDLVPAAEKYLADYLAGMDYQYVWGDAETISFPEKLDLIASSSTVQWFDDLENFVRKSSLVLKPGGVFAISTFGQENFKEIRLTAGEGLDYFSKEELEVMLGREGFKILLSEEYTETLYFDLPLDVLHHIRATGVNSLRKARWSRRQLSEFSESYKTAFSTPEGNVGLTYHPIIIIAEKL